MRVSCGNMPAAVPPDRIGERAWAAYTYAHLTRASEALKPQGMNAADLPEPPPLERLIAQGPLALFLDFDGTLVEIAPRPDAIAVPATLAKGLESLAQRLEGRLALVSGRSLDDIARYIGAAAIARAGSHGAAIESAQGEPIGDGPAPLPDEVSRALGDFARASGVDYEAKSHGGALHYRARPEREPQVLEFAGQLARKHGLGTKRGKCVVELVARGTGKHRAVHALMREPPFAGARPVFVGDDLTDEDGFSACRALGGFGILVGARAQTRADYALPGVNSVHQWLELT